MEQMNKNKNMWKKNINIMASTTILDKKPN